MKKKNSCSCGGACGIDKLIQEYENSKKEEALNKEALNTNDNSIKNRDAVVEEKVDKNNCKNTCECEEICDCERTCDCEKTCNCEEACDCEQTCDCDKTCNSEENCDCEKTCNCEEACDCENTCNCEENCDCEQTCNCKNTFDCEQTCDCKEACDCQENIITDENIITKINDSSCLKKEKKKKNLFVRNKNAKVFLSVFFGIILANVLIGLIWDWSIVKTIFTFFSDQILGMKWLNSLIGKAIGGIFGQNLLSSIWGGAIQFFIYDTIKIIALLCFLIFLISYTQSFFPPERTKKILKNFTGIKANLMGALLGTITPFCSCSSIPLFIGFTRAGLSSGITFSFLISSPLVDLGAFILLASTFGFPIAIAYVVVGILLAVIGGTIIDKTGVGKNVQDFVNAGSSVDIESPELTKRDRLIYAKEQMFGTLKKVLVYILIGVGIGAAIHNFIPTEWIQLVLGADKWYSVLVASIVGVPMYADIFGTIPIAEALFAKGVGVGTILSFMMSVTALSLPSLIMLSKAVKPKLLIAFFGIVVTGIILIGYIFNAFNFIFV